VPSAATAGLPLVPVIVNWITASDNSARAILAIRAAMLPSAE